eukprot:972976-Pelagomonas_calceolata.AAC.1
MMTASMMARSTMARDYDDGKKYDDGKYDGKKYDGKGTKVKRGERGVLFLTPVFCEWLAVDANSADTSYENSKKKDGGDYGNNKYDDK